MLMLEQEYIMEQLYYNNGHQEVVISLHFVKTKTFFLKKPLDLNPGQQAFLGSAVLCSVN